MARGKPVELATRNFDNQSQATAFFKEMLGRYKTGERVNEIDTLDLSALLERHTEFAQKIGCGLDHFEVMLTEHGTCCFRIVRKDNSGTDFSYPHCITQKPPTRKQEVSQAFRSVVKIDLFNARDAFFKEQRDGDGKVICAVSGERIGRDDAHMDHRPPMTFEVIVTTFLAGQGIGLDQIPLSTGRDEQVAPEITDEELREAFRKYHHNVARLDLVKNTINLAQSSKNRIKDGRIKIAG